MDIFTFWGRSSIYYFPGLPDSAMLKYIIYAIAAIVLRYAYQTIDLWSRARKQNAKMAPSGYKIPMGIDFLYENHKFSTSYKNLEVFKSRAEQSGKTYGLWVFGRYIIVTSDAENIKAILATQFNQFGKGQNFIARWREFLGDGIFNADGEIWSHARAMMRPQFLKERVADLDNFEDKMQMVFLKIPSGQPVDIMDLWFRFTLDSATEHLFGHCAQSLSSDQDNNEFARVFTKVQELQTKRERHGPLWKFWKEENAEMTEVLGELNAFVDKYVRLALEDTIDEKDESLLAALARDNRDPVFLRDSLVSALLAGRDTTAATLSWVIKELGSNPELYEELRQEVTEVLGADDQPTYSQLKNFKLVQGVINETLRLYPIVPFNVRSSFEDTTLPRGGGPDGRSPVFIPADSTIAYSTLLMQRTQDIPLVEEWHPKRWVEGSKVVPKYSPSHWSYIPFNGGPRICLGQNFALTEIAYAMARIVQRFKTLECLDAPLAPGDSGLRYDIILTPRYGVKARFTQ